jgi:uncharacterized protein YxeA
MNFYREFWRYSHLFTIVVFVIVIVLLYRGKGFSHTFDCHVHTPQASEYQEAQDRKDKEMMEAFYQQKRYQDKTEAESKQWEKEHEDKELDYLRENLGYYHADRDISNY